MRGKQARGGSNGYVLRANSATATALTFSHRILAIATKVGVTTMTLPSGRARGVQFGFARKGKIGFPYPRLRRKDMEM